MVTANFMLGSRSQVGMQPELAWLWVDGFGTRANLSCRPWESFLEAVVGKGVVPHLFQLFLYRSYFSMCAAKASLSGSSVILDYIQHDCFLLTFSLASWDLMQESQSKNGLH